MLPHANAIKHTKIELHCATENPFFRNPGNVGSLAGEDDFTKRAAIEVFQRLLQLVKTVALLNDRFQPCHFHGADKLFQRTAMPDTNP